MTTATEAPEETRTLQEVVRTHLGPVVSVVDRLDHPADMTTAMGQAIAVLCMRARDQIAAFNKEHEDLESWDAEALAVSIGVMAQMASEYGFEKSCRLEGPHDTQEAFVYMRTLTRMVEARWVSGDTDAA